MRRVFPSAKLSRSAESLTRLSSTQVRTVLETSSSTAKVCQCGKLVVGAPAPARVLTRKDVLQPVGPGWAQL